MNKEDDFFEQFDPKDIAELRTRAEKIQKNEGLFYDVHMTIPHEGATQFVETYVLAASGNLNAMSSLLIFASMVAQALSTWIEDDDD